jgi:hypothetical protein
MILPARPRLTRDHNIGPQMQQNGWRRHRGLPRHAGNAPPKPEPRATVMPDASGVRSAISGLTTCPQSWSTRLPSTTRRSSPGCTRRDFSWRRMTAVNARAWRLQVIFYVYYVLLLGETKKHFCSCRNGYFAERVLRL